MNGVPEIVVKLLEARGILPADFDAYFNPSLADLAEPEQLPGMREAAEAILAAVAAKRKIVVFGDYDCDGVCATAIIFRAVAAVAGDSSRVAAFLPDRLTEGYGMSDASVARLLRDEPDVGLVVTVDNGINSIDEIAALKAKGVDVVVTDHHLPTRGDDGEIVLPAALAVVNPKVAAPEALANLCGAGVAFLLAKALVVLAAARGIYAGGKISGPLIVLAGLATVTDVMPLVGQNRILVSEALAHFSRWAPLGLRELLSRAARSTPALLDAKDFGFLIGPRINASGRLASGMEALELVLAEDVEIARECARIVDLRNAERKQKEQKMLDEALTKVVAGAAAQVIDLPDGHPGVAGIVAARVMERLAPHGVPVCVVVRGHGSARAPEGYNIRDALVDSAAFLDRYGGHALAAGLTVKEGALDGFRRRFEEACRAQFASGNVRPETQRVDAWIAPVELTIELAEWIQRMRPFGEGNPEPVFGFRRQFLRDVRPLGSDGKHLSLTVAGFRAVWWNHGGEVETLRAQAARPCDLTFRVEISDYGERHLELHLRSLEMPDS